MGALWSSGSTPAAPWLRLREAPRGSATTLREAPQNFARLLEAPRGIAKPCGVPWSIAQGRGGARRSLAECRGALRRPTFVQLRARGVRFGPSTGRTPSPSVRPHLSPSGPLVRPHLRDPRQSCPPRRTQAPAIEFPHDWPLNVRNAKMQTAKEQEQDKSKTRARGGG